MSPSANSPLAIQDVSSAVIQCITENGYEATTAGDLANALGMSRSTFFRRFKSKDDVVFADHDLALQQLEHSLTAQEDASNRADLTETLIAATAEVLHQLTRDPEAARMRFDLLRDTPPLRARELVITHRYERVFARFLTEALDPEAPSWAITSLAAGIVAVHNRVLRAWLRGDEPDAARAVVGELRGLTALYARWLSPEKQLTPQRVLVAVYDTEGSADAVLAAVTEHLS